MNLSYFQPKRVFGDSLSLIFSLKAQI